MIHSGVRKKPTDLETLCEGRDCVTEVPEIVAHQGPINHNHHSYAGSPFNVEVLWKDEKTTVHPLSDVAPFAPQQCATYGKSRGLLGKPGWRHFKNMNTSRNEFPQTGEFDPGEMNKTIAQHQL